MWVLNSRTTRVSDTVSHTFRPLFYTPRRVCCWCTDRHTTHTPTAILIAHISFPHQLPLLSHTSHLLQANERRFVGVVLYLYGWLDGDRWLSVGHWRTTQASVGFYQQEPQDHGACTLARASAWYAQRTRWAARLGTRSSFRTACPTLQTALPCE